MGFDVLEEQAEGAGLEEKTLAGKIKSKISK